MRTHQPPPVGWLHSLPAGRWLILLMLAALALTGCATGPLAARQVIEQTLPPSTSTPTATPTATPTTTPSPTATPTATATPTPSPTATPAATATASPIATLNAGGRVALGAYLDGTPYDRFAAVDQFEQLTTHKMALVLWFQAWGDGDRDFMPEMVRLAAQKGLTPVITWEPWQRDFANPSAPQPEYVLTQIAAGAHDDYIRAWARAARDAQAPIILRFAHEQSTEPGTRLWYPWQGDPQGYRVAFRHIVQVFREEGANNVRFMWSAMWLDSWAAQYDPGSDVVDLVGTTVLNHGTGATVEWARWRTFRELFDAQYRAAEVWNKPIVLTELGTAEQGGDKAAWLRECLSSLEQDYPLVEGVLLLEVPSDREWPEINWSVASSPASLQAFIEATNTRYYK